MELIKADILPSNAGSRSIEPRGAVWIRIEDNGVPVNIINTHLDVRKRARESQMQSLLGPEWLSSTDCKGSTVLCGDFNALARSNLYKSVSDRLRDAQLESTTNKGKATFFTRMPTTRIDYIFIDETINVTKTLIPNTTLTRVASDHFPLIADIILET